MTNSSSLEAKRKTISFIVIFVQVHFAPDQPAILLTAHCNIGESSEDSKDSKSYL